MNSIDLYTEMAEICLPHNKEGVEVTSKQWQDVAYNNFYIILGMMLAKNSDMEEIKEMLRRLK